MLQCKVEITPDGCIDKEAIFRFLDGKWIPGYESSTDSRFVEPGKFFTVHRQLSKADRKKVAAEESRVRQKMIDELGRSKQERFERRQGLPRDKNGKLPVDYVEHTGEIRETTKYLLSQLRNYILSRPIEAVDPEVNPCSGTCVSYGRCKIELHVRRL